MNAPYKLHYAPDNASLIVRIALEMIGAPYTLELVDRRANAQSAPSYLALNPLGMIPALETKDGVIFETGAILLWLADEHQALLPDHGTPERIDALKWLFFISNSLHAGLRQMFYPEKFTGKTAVDALRDGVAARIRKDFAQLERLAADPNIAILNAPSFTVLDIYACACLRWAQLYPASYNAGWVQVDTYPTLLSLAARLDKHPSIQIVQTTEGLGQMPFSKPALPNPPIGSAT